MVEYAYPPLLPEGEGHSSELPSQWKHLPSLAMPDGSHNYEADTAFFHLPDLEDPRKTIFGISCYRQIGEKILHFKISILRNKTIIFRENYF